MERLRTDDESSIWGGITRLKDQLLPHHHGLHVTWYDAWHPALDAALGVLPETDTCPHELYRLLIRQQGPVPKRTALVTDHGTPVAVVGLRHRGRRAWEPLTQWITPGVVFPACPGYHLPVLEALGVDVWVAWWRMESEPPPSLLTRCLQTTATYRLALTENYEQYWREDGWFKTVRHVRNRCRELAVEVNAPGATEWTIRQWAAKWHGDCADADAGLPDRLLAAEYLTKIGRYYTLTLADQGAWVGGVTMMAHGENLVARVIYRDPHYDRCGIGDRLIDLSFSFGAEHGFRKFDLGGGHDYKKHWAPQEGEHWLFDVCPESIYMAKQALHWAREATHTVISRARPGGSGE